jgi:hypothetical protein
VGHVFEDVVDEGRPELTAALCGARGAQLALFAGERDEHLVAALFTANAGEALLPDPAVEVAGDRGVPAALPEAVALYTHALTNVATG